LVPAIGRGLAGVVIDGAWRDIDDIAERGFSVCGRATSSYSPGKRELGEINVPVACGGVVSCLVISWSPTTMARWWYLAAMCVILERR
jgi:hypothetical protein